MTKRPKKIEEEKKVDESGKAKNNASKGANKEDDHMEISSDECVEQEEMVVKEKDNKAPSDSIEVQTANTANTEMLTENINSPNNRKR